MATATHVMERRAVGGLNIWSGRVFFGSCTLLLFFATIYWNQLGKPWGVQTSVVLAYLMFGVHLALVFRRVSPMDPLVWVPIGLLLFYFGVPVAMEWVGIRAASGYDPWGINNGPFLDRGFCVALLAVVAALWGIHLAGVADLSRPLPRTAVTDRSLGVAATLFTIGALIMTAIGIAIVGPSAVFGLYHEWWDAKLLGADQRFVDTGLMFSGAGVYALLASDDPRARWRRWLAYAVLALCLFVALQKGDRTNMVTIGVGAGWCYSQRIKRVRWPSVIAVAFVALIAFPVIREWRAERRIEESKRASVAELFGGSIYSLGSAVNSIIFTVEYIPERKDYAWGMTFVRAVLTAIPNVGLEKGKRWAGDVTDSPSTWITWMVNPAWAATGGGYGFSMAAEWYYNFGMVGILFGMALVGFGLTRARNASTRSALALVWSATLFAGTSIWIRNIVGYAFKVATWPMVALWTIDRFLRSTRGRAVRRRPLGAATDS